ncbi:MAG TPA: heparinase [Clostridiales bacterium]|nr:heparinase [Clostridiales bacterium]
MFREWLNEHNLSEVLLAREDYHPFPTAKERDAWCRLPSDLRKQMIEYGEKYLNLEWPSLPAVRFMDFVRDGNRSRYEALHFARREALAKLVAAECMEGKGRFIDDIVNGIWHICEESFWGVPAHNRKDLETMAVPMILPDVTKPIIDLFAAETAGLLAWTYYLLEEQLNNISELITGRIKFEVKRRILDPYLNTTKFFWMGYYGRVNNWNPWINSNCLTAFLLLEDDPMRRLEAVSKIMYTLDSFINVYHPDGGCDEGTSYWGRAGASLFDCLEQLYYASSGRINFYNESIVKEIGRFIYRSHIAGDYFINFADGGAKVIIDGDLVYRYGKRIGDTKLMALGSGAKARHISDRRGNFSLLRELPAIFQYEEITRAAAEPCYIRDTWLDGIQVMAAREQEGTYQGLYLAAKGGHNNESHNHNDIGQFIVYANGMPVIIDVGVETYTKKTFGPDRYEIWTMQSAYHNLPTVNGIQQAPGEEHRAKDVAYQAKDEEVIFSMDIAPAYPKESGICSWNRKYIFSRSDRPFIEITDAFSLDKETDNITLSLMTHPMPQISDGTIVLEQPGKYCVIVRYDASVLKASSECIMIEDARLKPVWGERIYRVLLRLNKPLSQGVFTMKIIQE